MDGLSESAKVMKYRDCQIQWLEQSRGLQLVTTCDIVAGIGEAKHDILQVPIRQVVWSVVRTALLEFLSVGAEPMQAVCLWGRSRQEAEMDMIPRLRKEFSLAGYEGVEITGSSEDNLPTTETALGLTLIGRRQVKGSQWDLPCQTWQVGDILWLVGQPYVGQEVIVHQEEIPDYEAWKVWQAYPLVKELIPLGSQGIAGKVTYVNQMITKLETSSFSDFSCMQLIIDKAVQSEPLYKASAGPATAFLAVTASSFTGERFMTEKAHVLRKIGRLVERS